MSEESTQARLASSPLSDPLVLGAPGHDLQGPAVTFMKQPLHGFLGSKKAQQKLWNAPRRWTEVSSEERRVEFVGDPLT